MKHIESENVNLFACYPTKLIRKTLSHSKLITISANICNKTPFIHLSPKAQVKGPPRCTPKCLPPPLPFYYYDFSKVNTNVKGQYYNPFEVLQLSLEISTFGTCLFFEF